jgi:monovalent cation:H+ antiporter, CPA1 family
MKEECRRTSAAISVWFPISLPHYLTTNFSVWVLFSVYVNICVPEGESLFNDATGVISFNDVRGIIFTGATYSLLEVSLSFIWSMVGAIALGTAIGWIGGKILDKWKADEFVDFTFSLGLGIGGYIIADHFLHISGVVTTLFTAILIVTKHKEISRGVGKLFHKYWDYLGFITNSILFFLIGIPLLTVEIGGNTWTTLILIIAAPFIIMMLSRAAVVYGGSTFLRIFRVKIPIQWQNILTLGGLRGGMAVALVLSLSADYEFKNQFISLIIPLIAINLVVNPILLNQYLKKSKSNNRH